MPRNLDVWNIWYHISLNLMGIEEWTFSKLYPYYLSLIRFFHYDAIISASDSIYSVKTRRFVRILINDIDVWLRTKRYESVCRIDHAPPTKGNATYPRKKKEHQTASWRKMRGIVGNADRREKVPEKAREIGAWMTLRSNRSNRDTPTKWRLCDRLGRN